MASIEVASKASGTEQFPPDLDQPLAGGPALFPTEVIRSAAVLVLAATRTEVAGDVCHFGIVDRLTVC